MSSSSKNVAGIEANLRNNKTDTISKREVEKHNSDDSRWLIIDNNVYDITNFAAMHPGGEKIIKGYGGKDATEVFYDLHKQEVLNKYHNRLYVGRIKDSPKSEPVPTYADISEVPYAENVGWRDGWKSPYFTESHIQYRKTLRKWFYDNIRDEATALAKMDKVPSKELHKKLGQAGLYGARLGPGPWLHGRNIMGVRGEDFDIFHELITQEEWGRICNEPAVQDGMGSGLVIGLPPVLLFGQDEVKERVGKECLDGEKIICLAISEPFAGSDVANIKCTAEKSECGKYYIVNGIKKWITNGTFSDYFVTAVRTGGPGISGISLLLIERSKGVSTKLIKTSYGSSAGTAYVIFEDVKVPVENILGAENGGFQCIMSNFNHERWVIIAVVIAGCRFIIEECFKWAMQRKVFGKKLISQPVIRQKLAAMISQTESVYNWLENITYQMHTMDYNQQFFKLGGPIALLKMFCTRVCLEVADNACQILGGRSITKTGMGKWIERFQRSVKYGAILGGSEEVMADLGVRIAQRNFPINSKL